MLHRDTQRALLTRATLSSIPRHAGYAAGDAATGTEFEAFARHVGEGVVIIRIQYRLGPFGFLAGKAIKDNLSLIHI